MTHPWSAGVLDPGSMADAYHVAIASVEQVDVIVSWNFKHIVHLEKIRPFNAINLRQGYRTHEIRLYCLATRQTGREEYAEMRLPNPDRATVEEDKIIEYLLNPQHRFGASKAQFFTQFGFRAEEWRVLAKALQEHGRAHEVSKRKETGFGPRYQVEGELLCPDGRRPYVRTVWQLDTGEAAPRLITAYPVEVA